MTKDAKKTDTADNKSDKDKKNTTGQGPSKDDKDKKTKKTIERVAAPTQLVSATLTLSVGQPQRANQPFDVDVAVAGATAGEIANVRVRGSDTQQWHGRFLVRADGRGSVTIDDVTLARSNNLVAEGSGTQTGAYLPAVEHVEVIL